MATRLRAIQVRRYRARRLGLNGDIKDLLSITDANGGLHATSFMTPYISLIARNIRSPFHMLNNTQLQERKLVRVRAMRGTLFILPAFRLPMLLGAYRAKPRIINKLFDQWKVDPETIAQAKGRVMDALSKRPSTQKELRGYLGDLADRRLFGQRSERSTMLNFLLHLLQLEGLIISEKVVVQNTVKSISRYARVAFLYPDLPPSPSVEDCLKELIAWFFNTQGPADVDDLAWWTGMSKIMLKKVLGDQDLMEIEIEESNRRLLLPPENFETLAATPDEPLPGVRLLPYEDPYLKGHKNRSLILSGVPEAAVFERGGDARPTICVDGRIVGLWRLVEKGDDLHIGVEIFDQAAVDPDQLKKAREQVIEFVMAHFPKNVDNVAKGILTGTEPYA